MKVHLSNPEVFSLIRLCGNVVYRVEKIILKTILKSKSWVIYVNSTLSQYSLPSTLLNSELTKPPLRYLINFHLGGKSAHVRQYKRFAYLDGVLI